VNPDVIKALEDDIRAVHERFMAAMEQRLPAMQVETKERYFVVLTSLVGKLEAREKNLRDILQEMMSEAASLIFDEMSRG
jgi:predicted  nucleic acid-binding Zn-ribbon protein